MVGDPAPGSYRTVGGDLGFDKQEEQRSLALRLGGHAVTRDEAGDDPVLPLDDLFNELDPARSTLLLASLPPGLALFTTSGPVPPGVAPAVSAGGRARMVTIALLPCRPRAEPRLAPVAVPSERVTV